MLSCRSQSLEGQGDEFSMRLFTIQEVLEITGAHVLSGHVPNQIRTTVRRICTDSREARRGDLFVALSGERFEGEDFVGQAFRRGAVGAIIRSMGEGTKGRKSPGGHLGLGTSQKAERPFLLGVPEPLRAFQDLAALHRSRFHVPVVAVTGSNGKTTTKEMVAHVLARRWTVLKTEGNFNNRIGLPTTLFRLTARHQAAVLEMGVDMQGQTTRLCELARPTIGLITNIGPDHLEFFGSLDGSARAKAELVDMMPASGALVLNADDPFFEELASRASCPVVSFGMSGRAHVRGVDIVQDVRRGTTFRLVLPDRMRHPLVSLRSYGSHNISNALAAAAVGYLLGFSGSMIADGLSRFRPASMRSEIFVRDGIRFINDCYNANPASMKAAIDLLVELGGSNRTIAILGDMLELGRDAGALHRDIGIYLGGRGVSRLIAAGTLGREIAEGARKGGMSPEHVWATTDALEAAARAKAFVRSGDVVLIKASRGMRMERVVSALSEMD